MGSFDTVSINCPKCGYKSQTQSKAGSCSLNDYTRWDAPPEILVDIARNPICCYVCGTNFVVKIQVISEIEIIKKG